MTTSPVLSDDGAVYFGAQRFLYAVSPGGTLNWIWKAFAESVFQPAIARDGTIYFAAVNYREQASSNGLYPLHPDGSSKWRFRTSLNNEAIPSIGLDETVYFGGSDKFYAINPDGTEFWNAPVQWGYAAIRDDGSLLVAGSLGLLAMNLDGTVDRLGPGRSRNIAIGPQGIIDSDGIVVDANLSNIIGSGPDGPAAFADDYTFYALTPSSMVASLVRSTKQWEIGFEAGVWRSGLALTPDGKLLCGDNSGRLYAMEVYRRTDPRRGEAEVVVAPSVFPTAWDYSARTR